MLRIRSPGSFQFNPAARVAQGSLLIPCYISHIGPGKILGRLHMRARIVILLTLYAVAMAYVEAALVVHLRHLYY